MMRGLLDLYLDNVPSSKHSKFKRKKISYPDPCPWTVKPPKSAQAICDISMEVNEELGSTNVVSGRASLRTWCSHMRKVTIESRMEMKWKHSPSRWQVSNCDEHPDLMKFTD